MERGVHMPSSYVWLNHLDFSLYNSNETLYRSMHIDDTHRKVKVENSQSRKKTKIRHVFSGTGIVSHLQSSANNGDLLSTQFPINKRFDWISSAAAYRPHFMELRERENNLPPPPKKNGGCRNITFIITLFIQNPKHNGSCSSYSSSFFFQPKIPQSV